MSCAKKLQLRLPPPYLHTTSYTLLLSFGLVLRENLHEVGLFLLHAMFNYTETVVPILSSYFSKKASVACLPTSANFCTGWQERVGHENFMFWEMSHYATLSGLLHILFFRDDTAGFFHHKHIVTCL